TYNGNMLTAVTDTSGNYGGYPDVGGNIIGYDANGNMKTQKDKGILQIDYNFLNLPKEVKFDATYIIRNKITGESEERNVRSNYVYRADGTKLKKKYIYFFNKGNAERITTTDYLDGFQYTTSYSGALSLDFLPTAEGYFDFVKNKYIYNYADHLGNTRLSYFHNGSSIEVLEENNYYPFGLKHDGYNALNGNPAYKYKYNGKELQEETGMYDYGARFYMPDIGRWGVIDPLAEKYSSLSPYNYTLNNPIRYVDPDGRDGGVTGTGTQDDPFIVTANYYYFGLTKEQRQGLIASIADYNNGGTVREINTNDGKDGKIYVKFNLSAIESSSMEIAIAAAKKDKIADSEGRMIRIGNYIYNGIVSEGETAGGNNESIVSDASKVMAFPGMDYASKFEGDFNHEIGHNLGGVHGDPGKMMDPFDNTNTHKQGSKQTTTFTFAAITNDALRAIIGRTDITGPDKGYGVVDSKYLTPDELEALGRIPRQSGSNGKLRSIK
ncbi:MAG: RHS repeat-associated core domain-containing protein, partial [Bacilli bacterium]